MYEAVTLLATSLPFGFEVHLNMIVELLGAAVTPV